MNNEDAIRVLLLEGNADTGVKGHRRKTPLHLAGTPESVKLLMENLTKNSDPYDKMLKRSYTPGCTGNQKLVEVCAKSMKLKELEQCKCGDITDIPGSNVYK